MFEKPITKDANRMLCTLYKSYLEKRKTGTSKADAKYIGDYSNVQQQYFPNLLVEDVEETLCELWHNKFIFALNSDNHVREVTLTDDAIVYMENRFKKGLSEVIEAISALK
ncbi:hypothetical protein ACVS9P_03610 [Caproicibacterium sp. NSD3]